jgi:hypothetical protein
MLEEHEPKQVGISPDLARKLLEMNPKLRNDGFDTVGLVNQSQNAAVGKPPPKPTAPAAKPTQPTAPSESVVDTLAAIGKSLGEAEQTIDREIAALQDKKKQASAAALAQWIAWLQAHDPELRSPFTQEVLADEKALLDRLGFSVKDYVALRKKR